MIMNSRGEIQETGHTYSPNTTEIWKKNVILLHMAVWYQRIFERDRAATFENNSDAEYGCRYSFYCTGAIYKVNCAITKHAARFGFVWGKV